MTNDRELLELAAKAVGIDGEWQDYAKGIVILPRDPVYPSIIRVWRPLTDDGDALRLAVKLDIDLLFKPRREVPSTVANYNYREAHDGDPYAATRRAIVRAAAEIGRSMK